MFRQWLNICLLACEIYMRKLTHCARFSLSSRRVEPFRCTTLRMLDFSLSTAPRNFYFTVQLCLCDVCAIQYNTYVVYMVCLTLLAIFSISVKQRKLFCARCKVNKPNAFHVLQCQFFWVLYTLIARIALETYWQTVYQKDLNFSSPPSYPNSSAL